MTNTIMTDNLRDHMNQLKSEKNQLVAKALNTSDPVERRSYLDNLASVNRMLNLMNFSGTSCRRR